MYNSSEQFILCMFIFSNAGGNERERERTATVFEEFDKNKKREYYKHEGLGVRE